MVKIQVGSQGKALADFKQYRTSIRYTRQVLGASMPISVNFVTNLCGKDQWPHLRMSENIWRH